MKFLPSISSKEENFLFLFLLPFPSYSSFTMQFFGTDFMSYFYPLSKFGKTFIIAPSPKMIDEVLPNIFLHSSLAAFTRQLNTYGFRRLNREALTSTFSHSPDSSTPIKELSAWAHPNFQKNSPSLLNLLTPRPSRARELHRKGKLLLAESTFGMAGTSHVVLKNAFNRVKLVKKDKSYKS